MYCVVKDGTALYYPSEQGAIVAAHLDYRGHKTVNVLDPDEHRIWYSELSKDGGEVLVWSRKLKNL